MSDDPLRPSARPGPAYGPSAERGYGDYPPDTGWSWQGQTRGGDGHLDDGRYGPARYGLGPYYKRLQKRRPPDDELKKAVVDVLFYDTWVDADAITVSVADGIVTLSGVLPSYEEVRYATDDTWDVDGVLGVRCELTVSEE